MAAFMSSAAAVVIGALISGVVGVIVVFYQQKLARGHEVDKARASRLSAFSAAGWSATLAISELARAPVDQKETIEGSERFQALSDKFNSALAQIQLLDDGEVYTTAHRVNACLTALNREARSVQFDRGAIRAKHAELSVYVADYQRAARKALGSQALPDPLAWLPTGIEPDASAGETVPHLPR
jgi:hypothetical protein